MDASTRSVVESNRASWNVIAPRRSGMAIERLRAGETGLQDFERQLAGDVSGRRVVQLACSYGDEVLSWANLGARATGVDISDVAVATARARAAEAGIDADFRRADMLDPPADLVDLDLVYRSWGAICWVPDLTAFATRTTPSCRRGPAASPKRHDSRRSCGRSATSSWRSSEPGSGWRRFSSRLSRACTPGWVDQPGRCRPTTSSRRRRPIPLAGRCGLYRYDDDN